MKDLEVGHRVLLSGLRTAVYNGERGVIKSLPKPGENSNRYGVAIDGRKLPIAVRRENILLLSTNRQMTEEKRRLRDATIVQDLDPENNCAKTVNVTTAQAMRMYVDSLMTEGRELRMYGRKIIPMPNFYGEVLSNGGFSFGVHEGWGKNYLDLLSESVTGDFALGGEMVFCGNTLRFDCPDGTASLDNNEIVFSVLPFKDIVEALSPSGSVVDAAETVALSGLSKLARWAVTGDVTVDLIC